MPTSILITGASGFLGGNLALHLQRHGFTVSGAYHERPVTFDGIETLALDVCLPDAMAEALDRVKPAAVIHTAAMAAPDACAADVPATRQINVQGPKLLAAACAARGIKMIFTSTDLVFSGERAFQSETDPVKPLGVYGRSKADAEIAVLDATAAKPLVMRLPLMYGWGRGPAKGRNFSEQWLRSLLTGGKIAAFTDQWRTPLYVEDAANALRLAVEKDLQGIVHVAGPDRVNRHDIGVKLAKAFSLPEASVIASSVNDVVYRDPPPGRCQPQHRAPQRLNRVHPPGPGRRHRSHAPGPAQTSLKNNHTHKERIHGHLKPVPRYPLQPRQGQRLGDGRRSALRHHQP
jgi:dTDP-4-dehydrorhamnose reductase